MSNLRQAAQQALEALEWSKPHADASITYEEAITALRAALAESEQEPVFDCPRCGHCCPQSKPLTKQEIWKIHDLCIPPTEGYVSPVEFTRAIEAAHGIGEKHE